VCVDHVLSKEGTGVYISICYQAYEVGR